MILIYQLGKAGSTAMYEAIKEHQELKDEEIAYVHFMGDEIAEHFSHALNINQGAGIDRQFSSNILAQIQHGSEIASRMKALLEAGEPLRCVCGVRNPVDYCVSVFAQVLHDASPERYQAIMAQDDPAGAAMRLWRICLTKARTEGETSHPGDAFESFVAYLFRLSLNWCSLELFPWLNKTWKSLDAGQRIIQSHRGLFTAYIYRIEDASDDMFRKIAHFLGLQTLELLPANVSAEKPYGPLYTSLARGLCLYPDELRWFQESSFSKIFYHDAASSWPVGCVDKSYMTDI